MSTTRKNGKRDSGKSSSNTRSTEGKNESLHTKRPKIYISKGDSKLAKKVKKLNGNNFHVVKNVDREIKKERVEERKKSLYEFLKRYEDSGARLSIGGRKYTAERISEIMSVAENASYMPDIKINADGKVTNINYDKVSEK